MATITPNKTDSVEVLAHQAVTHPTTIVGSAISALTKRRALIFVYHGYVEATADTNPGKFLVQVRPDDGAGSVNEHWITVVELAAKGTTPDTEAMTATEPIGETVLACASTSGFAVEDEIYIQHTTLANSEWNKLRSVATNVSLTMIDGITNEQTATSIIWNDASKWVVPLDLESCESFRLVWMHEGATGANGHIKALASFHDSDNSV